MNAAMLFLRWQAMDTPVPMAVCELIEYFLEPGNPAGYSDPEKGMVGESDSTHGSLRLIDPQTQFVHDDTPQHAARWVRRYAGGGSGPQFTRVLCDAECLAWARSLES